MFVDVAAISGRRSGPAENSLHFGRFSQAAQCQQLDVAESVSDKKRMRCSDSLPPSRGCGKGDQSDSSRTLCNAAQRVSSQMDSRAEWDQVKPRGGRGQSDVLLLRTPRSPHQNSKSPAAAARRGLPSVPVAAGSKPTIPRRLSQAAWFSAGSAPTRSRIMFHAARLSAPSGGGPMASETEH